MRISKTKSLKKIKKMRNSNINHKNQKLFPKFLLELSHYLFRLLVFDIRFIFKFLSFIPLNNSGLGMNIIGKNFVLLSNLSLITFANKHT